MNKKVVYPELNKQRCQSVQLDMKSEIEQNQSKIQAKQKAIQQLQLLQSELINQISETQKLNNSAQKTFHNL